MFMYFGYKSVLENAGSILSTRTHSIVDKVERVHAIPSKPAELVTLLL
jgi:hypothetical protein